MTKTVSHKKEPQYLIHLSYKWLTRHEDSSNVLWEEMLVREGFRLESSCFGVAYAFQ